jgi:hypothetical protein
METAAETSHDYAMAAQCVCHRSARQEAGRRGGRNMSDDRLWRLRTNWRGKVIMQVQVRRMEPVGNSVEWVSFWRDAKLSDFPFPHYLKVLK